MKDGRSKGSAEVKLAKSMTGSGKESGQSAFRSDDNINDRTNLNRRSP